MKPLKLSANSTEYLYVDYVLSEKNTQYVLTIHTDNWEYVTNELFLGRLSVVAGMRDYLTWLLWPEENAKQFPDYVLNWVEDNRAKLEWNFSLVDRHA